MKTAFRSFAFAFMILALAVSGFAASTAVEQARVHTVAGPIGCTVSGATVATPSVITCAAAHNLKDGDQIQITGIGGTTTDNVLGYAKVTSYSTTTFGLYSDVALSAGVTGTGSYTSGGAVSQAFDVSALTGPWTLRVRIESLTAGKKLLLGLQDSADGFAADIKTLGVANITGSSPSGCSGIACGPAIEYTFRGDYLFPSARVGVTNGRLRLTVQSIDASASATISWFIEQ